MPGIRENALIIEEDDIVELRQLRYDAAGHLLSGVPFGSWESSNVHPMALQSWSPWSGHVYNGRVTGILRASQMLFVRLQFLPPDIMELAHHRPITVIRKFNVQFPVSRECYRPMYQALNLMQVSLYGIAGDCTSNAEQDARLANSLWVRSVLFPRQSDSQAQDTLNPGMFRRELFDSQLNWKQQKAVDSILSRNYGTLPYLISGPPGTGKTKTMIEAALQLLHDGSEEPHILLCAPSDPAADTLAERLRRHLSPCELFRLIRPARSYAEVPGSLLPYCHSSSGNHFGLPKFDQLLSFKVVVTTCRDAALLVDARLTNRGLYTARKQQVASAGFPDLSDRPRISPHWTALLMDEAAQAMEPEALIPISVVAPPSRCNAKTYGPPPLIAMAGDEHQLGPRTSLPQTPLKTSLFARLFQRSVYADHPLARSKNQTAPPPLSRSMLPIPRPAFANLIRNYRSHPAILAVPSHRFYFDTLESAADPSETRRLASWEGWEGRRWPVLFHANASRDEQELNEGGWYNVHEAGLACDYAASLVHSGLVEQEEVCIMSPFKAQVRLLRQTAQLPRFNLRDINIGPTEAFQGLEKGVVILCVTRSKTEFVRGDVERGWGIVNRPNQMNVALTRAKFGLIVIGKREVLSMDENWKAVLSFCDRNGLVTGDNNNNNNNNHTANHNSNGVDTYRDAAHDVITRLEKGLIAEEKNKNIGPDIPDRVLGGIGEQDEMWANELGYDEVEDDNPDDDESEDNECEGAGEEDEGSAWSAISSHYQWYES